MTDESVKQKTRRAKKAAIDKCEEMGYKIISSDNTLFCIVATRKTDIRMIRVAIGKLSDAELSKITAVGSPESCSKEIWHRREDGKFDIRELG